MDRIDIAPLSINQAFKGQRFRTTKYNKFINDVLFLLPNKKVKYERIRLDIVFGVSNSLMDIDNGLKPFIDCMVKKYDFDDRQIYELNVKKVIVKKRHEYIEFNLTEI